MNMYIYRTLLWQLSIAHWQSTGSYNCMGLDSQQLLLSSLLDV